MNDELIWAFAAGAAVIVAFTAYVIRQEWLSRIHFPDDQHEHGPFGR
jgi:hypothetical protein